MALLLHRFRPYLAKSLKQYDRHQFGDDLAAGITVGVVALPLAMAFAIASGVKPEAGIFTAIIAGFLISALGGSRVQIGGPAGAFIVIVYAIIARYGLGNLLVATVLAGVLLFMMGLFRIGSLIRYIPVAIVIGFTNGIAVLIMVSQVKDFLGLSIASMPADFVSALVAIARAMATFNPIACALALGCFLIVFTWPRLGACLERRTGSHGALVRFSTRLPGSIIALVLATVVVAWLGLPVETIGTRFGGIPQQLPSFALPDLSWESAKNLVVPTLTIALLGAIESLLCARIADNMIDDRHDPNQELMAQGVANFVTPFFGGIPATGTIARTTTNVRSGARSPVAGIIHAATLLAIVLIGAPLAAGVPLAALAAILMVVAYNMGEWREFRKLARLSVPYRVTMVSTFALTVVVDLTVAVEIGLVLACVSFIYRISSLTRTERIETPRSGIEAFRVHGSLFFGSVGTIELLLEDIDRKAPQVLLLDLAHVINIDTTGLDALDALRRGLRRRDAALVLCNLGEQPLSLVRRTGFDHLLEARNLCTDFAGAMARAMELVDGRPDVGAAEAAP
ncbi:MAG: STAS domain-containing protein [Burkholderiales bacterium]|nr:STAS domain-containing protein [Burkholderiales bacterium]